MAFALDSFTQFQSQTRSRPGCHEQLWVPAGISIKFQSQTRSRPGCHPNIGGAISSLLNVSISNEKPPRLPLLPKRRQKKGMPCFNLKREAAPVATDTTLMSM